MSECTLCQGSSFLCLLQGLQFQALCLDHSTAPQVFYKSTCSSNQMTPGNRDQHFSLPGRLAPLFTVRREVCGGHGQDLSLHKELGLLIEKSQQINYMGMNLNVLNFCGCSTTKSVSNYLSSLQSLLVSTSCSDHHWMIVLGTLPSL